MKYIFLCLVVITNGLFAESLAESIQQYNVESVSNFLSTNAMTAAAKQQYLDLAEHLIQRAIHKLDLYDTGKKTIYEPADFYIALGMFGGLVSVIGIICDDIKRAWYKSFLVSLGLAIFGDYMHCGKNEKFLEKCKKNYANALAIKQLIYQARIEN